jgi:hypothetical protein
MLKNGRRVILRTFDGREWRFTKMGKEYYRHARKEYDLQLPITNIYIHANKTESVQKGEWIPSHSDDTRGHTLFHISLITQSRSSGGECRTGSRVSRRTTGELCDCRRLLPRESP